MSGWFDGHLDLACLAVNGRDMHAPLAALTNATHGPWPPAACTLPSLADGAVGHALATIFTQADGDGLEGYPAGDAPAAARAGHAQLEVYAAWHARGAARVVKRGRFDGARGPIQLGILVENADPIGRPDDLPAWIDRGVCAIGLCWAVPSRYASGNAGPADAGLTDLGRAMVRAMDDLGVVHDLAHLSQAATDELLSLTDAPVVASHSNCRALLGGNAAAGGQRHLAAVTIRELDRRGGVVGLNLCANFQRSGIAPGERPTIDDAIAHVERVCELTGSRDHVGLGSDLDGGFSAAHLPAGIDAPRDYAKLVEALATRGWSQPDVEAFRRGNWLRFWSARAR